MKLEIPKLISNFGGDLAGRIRSIVNSKLSEIHTTTIGIIESFDSETQTAVIQPAIKRVVTTEKSETIIYETEAQPLLVDIPIVFPGGGDWFMTFPVKKGDECLIFSMERSIDNWKKNGGLQDPSNYKRKLSFKDAVAMVGIQSKASSLPAFNSNKTELRSRDGETTIALGSGELNLLSSDDNAVRFSALETAYDELNDKYNDLISRLSTWVVIPNDGGAALKTLLSALPSLTSTGDISGAKIDEITVP